MGKNKKIDKTEISFLTKEMHVIPYISDGVSKVVAEIGEVEEEIILHQIGEDRIIEIFPESVAEHVKSELKKLLEFVFIKTSLTDIISQNFDEIISNYIQSKNEN